MTQKLRHAIIVCHPAETSFTLAIAQRYAQAVRALGHEVMMRDLYRIGFDPVLREDERNGKPGSDVLAELDQLEGIDVFVLVYPVWFGAPPAMLKGYIDRVFGAGRMRGSALGEGERSPLEGKNLVSLTLSGSMRTWLDEKGVLLSLRNLFDRYLADVFGLAETYHYHFDGIHPDLPERDAGYHLAEVDVAARDVLGRIGHEWQMRPPKQR